MRIAVTTPTGHVGSVVTQQLLDSGVDVVLLCRDGEKCMNYGRRGAEIRQGLQDDAAFVTAATEGCDALFWVTPPNMAARDLRQFQRDCGQAAASAIRANNIQRAVNLSSIGAQQGTGGGPINGLHDVEELLNAACPNVTHLRAGFFFENFLFQKDSIKNDSCINFPTAGSRKIPMVATRDIGIVAARCLLDTNWTGHIIRGVHGPADLSIQDACGQITRGLGHTIRFRQVSEDIARRTMKTAACSDSVIDAMLEMERNFESGAITVAEPRTSQTTTPTTLATFAEQVIAPLVGVTAGAPV
ncbi:MAG: NmrA family NAD(P)-binding protein [Phycisphaerae bacterium]